MKDQQRYTRQVLLPEIGTIGQSKLAQTKLLIVGMGGLGCPAALYLAAAGIGHLGLLDHDRVDESNLNRQTLYRESDIGQPKVLAAKKFLSRQNSRIKIRCHNEHLTVENAVTLFRDYDIIIDGTDNFPSKYLINDACLLTNKPWVYASIYKFQGQVSTFNYKNGPTYRCLFPRPPKQQLNCEATGVVGALAGNLGMLQAMEALKIILGIGQVLSGTLKLIDMLTMQDQLVNFNRKQEGINSILNEGLKRVELTCEVREPDKVYLDVREKHEIPQLSGEKIIKIPLGQIPNRIEEIPSDIPVYVVCQSGIRSQKAINLLESNFGYINLINVSNGVESIIPQLT